MNQMSLSRVVVSRSGDRLVTFEQAAHLTQTSITILERFATLGLIEPVESMLRLSDLTRVVQIMRLRRDLGLNLVGAAMVLDMAQEIAQLRAQLQALRRQRL
jgi:ATP sulfurylase